MSFPIVTIALTDGLPLAIVVAVQSIHYTIHYKSIGPYPAHLFIRGTGEGRLRQESDFHF